GTLVSEARIEPSKNTRSRIRRHVGAYLTTSLLDMAATTFPERIVCLTEEPTEVLYALGEARRIVGISGFTVRPARARKEKPKVSAFTSAKVDEITRLAPDLVIGFSDIQ